MQCIFCDVFVDARATIPIVAFSIGQIVFCIRTCEYSTFFGTNSVLVHYALGLSFHVFFVEDGDVLVPYWYDGIILFALDFTEFQHDQDYIMGIFFIEIICALLQILENRE